MNRRNDRPSVRHILISSTDRQSKRPRNDSQRRCTTRDTILGITDITFPDLHRSINVRFDIRITGDIPWSFIRRVNRSVLDNRRTVKEVASHVERSIISKHNVHCGRKHPPASDRHSLVHLFQIECFPLFLVFSSVYRNLRHLIPSLSLPLFFFPSSVRHVLVFFALLFVVEGAVPFFLFSSFLIVIVLLSSYGVKCMFSSSVNFVTFSLLFLFLPFSSETVLNIADFKLD